MIIGVAGSGKSTLLRHIAAQVSTAGGCAILLQARRADAAFRVVSTGGLAECIRQEYELDVSSTEVLTLLQATQTVLLVDGLDEAGRGIRDAIAGELCALDSSKAMCQVLVTSRPIVELERLGSAYQILNLAELTQSDIRQFVSVFSRDDPKRAAGFLACLRNTTAGELAAAGPLLLVSLWVIYQYHGYLPRTDIAAIRYVVDVLLQEWDRSRHIASRTRLEAVDVSRFLTNLAGAQLTHCATEIPMTAASAVLANLLDERSEESADALAAILAGAGFVTTPSDQMITFSHRFFFEYFAARALVEAPTELLRYVEQTPGCSEILRFATQLTPDPAVIARHALAQGRLFLAAKAANAIPDVEGAAIRDEVRDMLRRELPFFFDGAVEPTPTVPVTAGRDLVSKLRRLRQRDLTTYEKGRLLEEFASDMFGAVMKVIATDLRSEHGEFDLVLENEQTIPFWLEYGAHALVECKNRDRKATLAEAQAFCGKLQGLRFRLGFFLSIGGFTRDALRVMQNHAFRADGALIVPIDLEGLSVAAAYPGTTEEFLKQQVRNIRVARMF